MAKTDVGLDRNERKEGRIERQLRKEGKTQ